MKPAIECRDLPGSRVEIRGAPGAGGASIRGRIPYNSLSEDMGGWREIIAPSAFTRTLNAKTDVKLLWSHNEAEVLGSTVAGTLRLENRGDGLHFSADLPTSQAARIEALARGDVTGVSFGFTCDKTGSTLDTSGPEAIRTLTSVRLWEISLVAWPAYPESSVSMDARSTSPADETERLRAELDLYGATY